jgi:hypothetical protein
VFAIFDVTTGHPAKIERKIQFAPAAMAENLR